MATTITHDNRVCSECEATSTYSNWRRDGNGEGWLCKKCYMKFYFRRNSQKHVLRVMASQRKKKRGERR